VKHALGLLGLLGLLGCQAVSGLDDLRLVGMDASAQIAQPVDAGRCTPGELIADGSCEVVSQCGCAPEQHCQVRNGMSSCVAPGVTPVGASCANDDACAAGSACVDRMCARYCASDVDCPTGVCRTFGVAAGASVKACVLRCDFATEVPCGDGVQCARFDGDPELGDGDFCAVPSATCETDGVCDEPSWGTRRCAEGSDKRDCTCTPTLPNASCDLAAQCGCGPNTHCALLDVLDSTASVGCVADVQPIRQPGFACSAEGECPGGYSCWRGLCEKYCSRDADCGAGRCIAIRAPNEVDGVRLCTLACDFVSNSGCEAGASCVRAPDGLNYCLIPRSPCPYAGDFICDEPEGTRICAEGTDAADCP
jgi:hypothetical protein